MATLDPTTLPQLPGPAPKKALPAPGGEPGSNGHPTAQPGHRAGDSAGGGHADEIGAPPAMPRTNFFVVLLLLVLAVAGLAGLFLAGYLPLHHRETALAADVTRIKNALPRVNLAHPRQSPAVIEAQLPGDVQAVEETTIYPRTSGYLKKWWVDIGADVKKNDLLAEIDAPEVDQELRQAIATLGQLDAKKVTADANLKLAQTTLARFELLVATKAVSAQEVDERRAAVDTASSTVTAAIADVAAGDANVKRLKELQSFSKVYAPFDGTITARNVDTGALLTSGNGNAQALFHIARTDPVRIFMNVPQMYAPGVRTDQEAKLIVRELPGRKFVAKVTRTARSIDPVSRTLLTELQAPNPDRALLTGMYIQVRLPVTRENPPLLVPSSALIINSDGTRVATVDDQDRVHFHGVEVDGDFGADVGISSGLTPDMRVITNPGERMTEGGPARIDAVDGKPVEKTGQKPVAAKAE